MLTRAGIGTMDDSSAAWKCGSVVSLTRDLFFVSRDSLYHHRNP